MNSVFQHIAKELGTQVTGHEPVQGGDINECFRVCTGAGCYFLKINDANRFPQMFEQEAAGLETLRLATGLTIPMVIKQSFGDGRQWLLLEWLEKGQATENSLQLFGRHLAGMHRHAQPFFGWYADNYIGSLAQRNTAHSNWADFYTQCRIMPLVTGLFNNGVFNTADVQLAEALCKKLGMLFPAEPPALLHGDLWGGNFMITSDGQAAIFDPAVYHGHREMDIGMTKLFGGFSNSFYEAYHEYYPLEKGWLQRLPLAQLYPLLVHAVLFGGHYAGSVRQVLKRFG